MTNEEVKEALIRLLAEKIAKEAMEEAIMASRLMDNYTVEDLRRILQLERSEDSSWWSSAQ